MKKIDKALINLKVIIQNLDDEHFLVLFSLITEEFKKRNLDTKGVE